MTVIEPTWDEIQRWKERLEDREFQRSFWDFQDYVYRLFDELRKQTGLKLIRTIIPRDEIKTLDSLVEKIVRKRDEGNWDQISIMPGLETLPSELREKVRFDQESGALIFRGVMTPADREHLLSLFSREEDKQAIDRLSGKCQRLYGFEDVKDFVGLKVLCPYMKDRDEVAGWLFRQGDSIRVIERVPRDGWHNDPSGYKGYNFTVYPPVGAPASWATAYCEVQIKTLVEEAWDAKTHDLAHKARGALEKKYRERFINLSGILSATEQQGEYVRDDVEEIFQQTSFHRDVATKELLAYAKSYLNGLRNRYNDIPLIGENMPCSPRDLAAINEALRSEWAAGRDVTKVCFGAAHVALCVQDPLQTAFALQLINDLVMRNPDSPSAEVARACIYWSLSRFSRSVESCRRVLEKIERQQWLLPDIHRWKSDCCYYITDATLFFTYVPPDLLDRVPQLVDEVKSGPMREAVNVLDTVGFVKVVFATSPEEVSEGAELVKKALSLAEQSGDTRVVQLARAFCARHLQLADRRLKSFGKVGLS